MLELLTTVAVIGISASLAVPGFVSAVRDGEQTARINELVGSLHLSRSEAVNRNRPVTICPSENGRVCDGAQWSEGWLVFVDANTDGEPDDSEATLRRVTDEPNVRIHSAQFPGALTYTGEGRLVTGGDAAGEFLICNRRGHTVPRRLSIGFAGKPRLGDKLGPARSCD